LEENQTFGEIFGSGGLVSSTKMSKPCQKKPTQRPLKQKSLLVLRLFDMFALLIVIPLAISVLMSRGAVR
jgi:hypothetical protein